MIDKQRIEELRKDGANDALRRHIAGCLTRATRSMQAILQSDVCNREDFQAKIFVSRDALDEAEAVAEVLIRDDLDIVDSL